MTAMGQVFGGFIMTQVVPTDERGEQIGDSYGNIPIPVVQKMRHWVTDLADECPLPGSFGDAGLDLSNALKRLTETHPDGEGVPVTLIKDIQQLANDTAEQILTTAVEYAGA
tara:strand:+ start:490 stop:825 length:336 start_codon:yes stop_codon:yes gene_type:complete